MADYSNAAKLSAVVVKWSQPAISKLSGAWMSGIPSVNNIEQRLRASGFVGCNWSLGSELAPIINSASSVIIEPMLQNAVKNIPDESIPQFAHGIVDAALENGNLSLFDGRVTFEHDDLEELKRLLNYNLPLSKTNKYKVKEE